MSAFSIGGVVPSRRQGVPPGRRAPLAARRGSGAGLVIKGVPGEPLPPAREGQVVPRERHPAPPPGGGLGDAAGPPRVAAGPGDPPAPPRGIVGETGGAPAPRPRGEPRLPGGSGCRRAAPPRSFVECLPRPIRPERWQQAPRPPRTGTGGMQSFFPLDTFTRFAAYRGYPEVAKSPINGNRLGVYPNPDPVVHTKMNRGGSLPG